MLRLRLHLLRWRLDLPWLRRRLHLMLRLRRRRLQATLLRRRRRLRCRRRRRLRWNWPHDGRLLLLLRTARWRRWSSQLLLRLRWRRRRRRRLWRDWPHDRRLLRGRTAGARRRAYVAPLQLLWRRRHGWWCRGRRCLRQRSRRLRSDRRSRAWSLHRRAAWRCRPAGLPRRAVWLWRRRRFRHRSRRDRCSLRSARRSGAEAPALIIAECLRLRHAGDRLHHGLRRLQRRLDRAWPSGTWLPTLVPLSRAIEILRPHLHGTGDALRARQNARLHMEGLYRPTRRGGDNSRSNTWIDGEASAMIAMLKPYRAIDDHRPSENDDCALWRQEVDAHAWRHQIARRQEDPVTRIVVVFVDHLIRRQRRPADIVVAPAPIDPGRTPFVTGHPEPAEPAIMRPATIVKRHPTPVGLFLIGNPIPAPFLRIDPSSIGVRAPPRRQIVWHPDFAEARVRLP